MVSTSPSRLLPNTCHGVSALALQAGRLSCAITPPTTPASICSSVPTIGFKLLYGLVILRLEQRRLVWTDVTPHPTAEWVARQITEAFPWDEAPRYLIRDRDTSYGTAVTRRLPMGIRDRPITPRSPWQNGHVERLIGSIRRECLDHVVVLGERHLRHLLANYATYYNGVRTHLALDKDTPLPSTGAVSRVYRISHVARRSPSALRSDGIIGRHSGEGVLWLNDLALGLVEISAIELHSWGATVDAKNRE